MRRFISTSLASLLAFSAVPSLAADLHVTDLGDGFISVNITGVHVVSRMRESRDDKSNWLAIHPAPVGDSSRVIHREPGTYYFKLIECPIEQKNSVAANQCPADIVKSVTVK